MATKKAREGALQATREIYARDNVAAGSRKEWLKKAAMPVYFSHDSKKTFPYTVMSGDFVVEAFDTEQKMRAFAHNLQLNVTETTFITIEAKLS